jgi:hypothetical protein
MALLTIFGVCEISENRLRESRAFLTEVYLNTHSLYHETVQYFESNERRSKACVPRHGVHHFQFNFCYMTLLIQLIKV